MRTPMSDHKLFLDLRITSKYILYLFILNNIKVYTYISKIKIHNY